MAPPAALRDFLDQWRLSRGWSIQRLADEIGVHQSLVSKWLHLEDRRRVVPSPRHLRRIAELTSVRYGQLRQYADPEDLDVDGGTDDSAIDPELAATQAALRAGWSAWDDGFRRAIRVLVGAGGGGFTSYKPWDPAFAVS